MLNNAAAPFAGYLQFILERATGERAIINDISREEVILDTRTLYVVTYALIRVGNAVARYSRQLEREYPEYRWVFWVDLRNEFAHELGNVNAEKAWQAVSLSLPELIQVITGEPPS